MIGNLKSGERVVDRHNSHLHEGVLALLPEVLGRLEAQGRQFFVEEVDLGRLIGETTCVETSLQDEVVYAQRPRRFGLSRFVKNRSAESCSVVVVILKRDDHDQSIYVLITAFVGHRPEPEPWDKNATEKSVAYWSSYALVWGSEPVIPGTETSVCPW